MAALDAPPALRAVADLDVEAPHNGPHHREVLLILRRDALHCDRAAAIRTLGRQRCLMDFVDLRRPPPARLPPVLRTGAPSRTFATTLPPLFGEGRRLAETRAPRRVKLLLEPSGTALPAIPVALGARQILAQLGVLTLQLFDAAVPRIPLPPGWTGETRLVMPKCVAFPAHARIDPRRESPRGYAGRIEPFDRHTKSPRTPRNQQCDNARLGRPNGDEPHVSTLADRSGEIRAARAGMNPKRSRGYATYTGPSRTRGGTFGWSRLARCALTSPTRGDEPVLTGAGLRARVGAPPPRGRAHSRFPGHALTPTGVMAIRCKQFHLPDL